MNRDSLTSEKRPSKFRSQALPSWLAVTPHCSHLCKAFPKHCFFLLLLLLLPDASFFCVFWHILLAWYRRVIRSPSPQKAVSQGWAWPRLDGRARYLLTSVGENPKRSVLYAGKFKPREKKTEGRYYSTLQRWERWSYRGGGMICSRSFEKREKGSKSHAPPWVRDIWRFYGTACHPCLRTSHSRPSFPKECFPMVPTLCPQMFLDCNSEKPWPS